MENVNQSLEIERIRYLIKSRISYHSDGGDSYKEKYPQLQYKLSNGIWYDVPEVIESKE
jgi:hypothetical protein